VWAITQGRSAEELTRLMAGVFASAPNIEWIAQISMSRHCSINALTRWLAPFLQLDTYQTLDLSGDKLAQPIENFRPLYRVAKDKGLRLKAHVGEWGTADDVWRACEELELDEIQHGIAAAEAPAVMRFLADNRVRLNVCPTSNVTVNTDDALVFGPSVSEEFLGLCTVTSCQSVEPRVLKSW
jgi:adenosine deaminase